MAKTTEPLSELANFLSRLLAEVNGGRIAIEKASLLALIAAELAFCLKQMETLTSVRQLEAGLAEIREAWRKSNN